MTRTPVDPLQSKGCRRLSGLAATVVASLASVATTSGPNHTYVSLTDQTIALSQTTPQQQRRFRVETSTGRFQIEARLTTTQATHPTLSITPVGDGDSIENDFTAVDTRKSSNVAELSVHIVLNCNDDVGAPCTADFEASCSAQSLSTNFDMGVLTVNVSLEGVDTTGKGENSYVAIEPL
jgi:hypothetical protein